jgi:hypothetical protein
MLDTINGREISNFNPNTKIFTEDPPITGNIITFEKTKDDDNFIKFGTRYSFQVSAINDGSTSSNFGSSASNNFFTSVPELPTTTSISNNFTLNNINDVTFGAEQTGDNRNNYFIPGIDDWSAVLSSNPVLLRGQSLTTTSLKFNDITEIQMNTTISATPTDDLSWFFRIRNISGDNLSNILTDCSSTFTTSDLSSGNRLVFTTKSIDAVSSDNTINLSGILEDSYSIDTSLTNNAHGFWISGAITNISANLDNFTDICGKLIIDVSGENINTSDNFEYYIDNLNQSPTISNFGITLFSDSSATYKYGLLSLGTSATTDGVGFLVSVDITNLASEPINCINFFRRDKKIFELYGDVITTTISSVINGVDSTSRILDNLLFDDKMNINTVIDSFNKTFILKAFNLVGDSSSSTTLDLFRDSLSLKNDFDVYRYYSTLGYSNLADIQLDTNLISYTNIVSGAPGHNSALPSGELLLYNGNYTNKQSLYKDNYTNLNLGLTNTMQSPIDDNNSLNDSRYAVFQAQGDVVENANSLNIKFKDTTGADKQKPGAPRIIPNTIIVHILLLSHNDSTNSKFWYNATKVFIDFNSSNSTTNDVGILNLTQISDNNDFVLKCTPPPGRQLQNNPYLLVEIPLSTTTNVFSFKRITIESS